MRGKPRSSASLGSSTRATERSALLATLLEGAAADTIAGTHVRMRTREMERLWSGQISGGLGTLSEPRTKTAHTHTHTAQHKNTTHTTSSSVFTRDTRSVRTVVPSLARWRARNPRRRFHAFTPHYFVLSAALSRVRSHSDRSSVSVVFRSRL